MPIRIRRRDALYEAEVTPPHGRGVPWATEESLSSDALIVALLRQGCHQTDIGDAFYETDPEWQFRDVDGSQV